MKKVLIIEDDIEIIRLLEIHLKDLHCEVLFSQRGDLGLIKAVNENFNLIILDLMLPGIDGVEVCQKIRSKNIKTPIIMLTSKSEEIDKVLGLEIGADDYITKPFSIREFIARVKVIFRREKIALEIPLIEANLSKIKQFGDLLIDIEFRKVTINDFKIELSPKEYELLVFLSSNPGKSYNRKKLLNLVWGYDFDGYEHTVNSHINRLRAKIESDMASPKYILTTWGIGYKFNEDI